MRPRCFGAVHRRVRSGRWRTVRRGVYAIGAAPPGWEQEVHAAVLAVGADALGCQRTGARLWSLVPRSGRIELLVPREQPVRLQGVTVHRSILLPKVDVATADGIPVTSVAQLRSMLLLTARTMFSRTFLVKGLVR